MTNSTIVKTCLASVIIALVVYLTYQFVDLRRGNYLTNVAPADCIVVLGASVWPGAQPSPVLKDRIARAAELYHQGVAKKIICTGGLGKYPPAEAEICKQNLMQAGVAASDIIMELASHSTADQAEIIKKICDEKGYKSIALVTSFYHEKRALKLFRVAGFNDIQDARCTHERFEDLNYWVARDALALTVMNWWHWIAIGLGIALLALTYQAIRQRKRVAV